MFAWLALAGGLAISIGSPADCQRIHEAGQAREFELARDELVESGVTPRLVQLAHCESAAGLGVEAGRLQAATGSEYHLVLYERGVVRNEFTRRMLTREVLARLVARSDPHELVVATDGRACRAVQGMPDWWLFEAQGPDGALRLAELLRNQAGVLQAEPQLTRLRQKKLIPDDSLFPQQWHLRNTGQSGGLAGVDINVVDVWDTLRGTGITIGIVDDGVQSTQPDLSANFNAALSANLNSNSFNLSYDTHGTPVAGVVAARGNNDLGVCGVAPEASIADIRLLGDAESDEADRAAMLHRNDAIQVKNNSWGATDGVGTLEGPGPLMAEALAESVSAGRGGLGEVFVFAGGNGRIYGEDVNYDGFANSIFVMAVGAVSDQGLQASYSEPGACLVAVGPSRGSTTCIGRPGILTTDLVGNDGRNPGAICETALVDYTATFGGTSAAAPAVAGVTALILQANPTLSWRDEKEIILRTAAKVSLADPDWGTNAAGVAHNHRFGGGLVNAGAAIALATNWSNLRPATIVTLRQTNLNLAVPDNDAGGVSLFFTVTNEGFRVEQTALTANLPHARFGDLAITLISPSGTASRLAEMHNSSGQGYNDWTFSSVRSWGEQAQGIWTVHIADLAPNSIGTLNALRLEIHGSQPVASISIEKGGTNLLCTLRAAAPGWNYALEASPDLVNWTNFASAKVGLDGQAIFPMNNTQTAAQFFRAGLLP